MIRDRRLKTAVATLLAAFAVAHLMQFGMTAGLQRHSASGDEEAGSERAARAGAALVGLPAVPGRGADPLPLMNLDRLRLPPPTLVATPLIGGNLSAYGLPCERSLSIDPAEGGELVVRVSATCDPLTRVVLVHAGLRFAVRTDVFGQVRLRVPALSTVADVRAALPDGDVLSAEALVPDADLFERVAISSDGHSALAVHALEFGAGYGDPGHVHHGTPASASKGRVQRLGDPDADSPLIAEVYTFPSGESISSGTVRLHVEGVVTEANCGRDVAAEAVQAMPGGPPSVVALRVTMPDCDAAGDILVLKNVLRDLRIARN